jgi:hypothetical protein
MKKFVTVSIFAIALIALTGSVALANYGTDNKLSGSLKEKGTLKVIVGAKVKLYKTSGKLVDSDKTSKKGHYSFKDLSEKKYVVKAKATGYHSPKDAKKDKVSYTVKVDGNTTKKLFLAKN